MTEILAVVADLMLASRVSESLGAAGHSVTVVGSLPSEPRAELIVCDLDAVDPERVVATGLPSLGFYSHLDTSTGERARAAGIDTVVPRSRMSRELPELVNRLIGSG